MHEDRALINLTFDVNVFIGSGFKQYYTAFVEGAKTQIVSFFLLLLTAWIGGLSPGDPL